MPKIYLEYLEDQIESMNMNDLLDMSFTSNDENLEEDNNDEETEKIENVMFMPSFLYRNPVDESLELDIDYDPKDFNQLHLVIVRYSENDGVAIVHGKWHIFKICQSRRQARQTAQSLEEDQTLWENMPWDNENCKFEICDVVSISVED
jgi:hypothetical protein